MIESENQYRVTKARVRRFEVALAELEGVARPASIGPEMWQA